MQLREVKQVLFDLVTMYHPSAMVVWSKTKGVTPKPPYITLSYSNLTRSASRLSDDENENEYYNYSMNFEMNLYTAGREIVVGGKSTGAYENTAVEDLEEFVRFLDSDEITDMLAEKNVTIVMTPPIRDLSELIGDTRFNYRSMVEFRVDYVGTANGRYGVSGSASVPNSSGGGLEKFTDAESYVIEEVSIKEET